MGLGELSASMCDESTQSAVEYVFNTAVTERKRYNPTCSNSLRVQEVMDCEVVTGKVYHYYSISDYSLPSDFTTVKGTTPDSALRAYREVLEMTSRAEVVAL